MVSQDALNHPYDIDVVINDEYFSCEVQEIAWNRDSVFAEKRDEIVNFNPIVAASGQLIRTELPSLNPTDDRSEVYAAVVGDFSGGQCSLVLHRTNLPDTGPSTFTTIGESRASHSTGLGRQFVSERIAVEAARRGPPISTVYEETLSEILPQYQAGAHTSR